MYVNIDVRFVSCFKSTFFTLIFFVLFSSVQYFFLHYRSWPIGCTVELNLKTLKAPTKIK